jgi:four helix bundle protein
VQDYRKVKIWQKAHELTLSVYEATRDFPREETYGLRSQLRGSSSSIGMNVAEGCGRKGDKEFSRFLHIAMGSTNELEYQLLLSRDLGYIDSKNHVKLDGMVAEVKKMLTSLLRRLRAES